MTDLQAAIEEAGTKRQNAKFTPEVAQARVKEQSHRGALAQQMAFRALRNLHDDEFKQLYELAKVEIAKQRGLLPGDEEES
jgi:hypothetical protein